MVIRQCLPRNHLFIRQIWIKDDLSEHDLYLRRGRTYTPPRAAPPDYWQSGRQTPVNNRQVSPEDLQLRLELQEMRNRLNEEIQSRRRLEEQIQNNANQSNQNRSNGCVEEPTVRATEPVITISSPSNNTNTSTNCGQTVSDTQPIGLSPNITLPREAFDLIKSLSQNQANVNPIVKAVNEKVEIPKFNGNIPDAFEWHREFMRITESKRWTDEDRMKNIPNYLTDSAKTWFNAMYRTGMQWPQFMTLFHELYIPDDTIQRFKMEFNTARQRGTETATQYFYRVIELGSRISSEIDEAQVKVILKRGLRDKAYQLAISSRNYTLAEIVDLLKGYDSVEAENLRRQQFKDKNQNNNKKVNNSQTAQTGTGVNSSTTVTSTETTGGTNNSNQQQRQPRQGFQMICANCRGVGHKVKECQLPYNKANVDQFYLDFKNKRNNTQPEDPNQTAPKTASNSYDPDPPTQDRYTQLEGGEVFEYEY